MSLVVWFHFLTIVCGLQNGSVLARITYCAYYDGSGAKTQPTKAPIFKYSVDLSQDTGQVGEVMSDNETIRCLENRDFCYTFWYADPENKTKVNIVMQGCWFFPVEDHNCSPETCLSNTPPNRFPQYTNSKFCCCSGNMCNVNISDVYDPELYTTVPSLTPAARYIQDSSYKERTVILALVSVFSVALITICIYLLYRICLSNHKPALDSLNIAEAPPTPNFDLEDLKLCNLVSKGRYAEVWKGILSEEEIAVKIYSSNHKQFYANEKYIYSLPFMEHENVLQFYGGHERLTQEQALQYILVFSYVPQGNLMGYLKNNTVDWKGMCRMFYTIAKGLAHLHTDITKGDQFKPAIGHRDLNTRNILVKSDLSCVIADFGFAITMMGSKLIHGGHTENAEQSSLTDVGTLRYMAPELLDGAVNLRDCEASLKQIDIYALGLVMWELGTRCSDLYQGSPIPEFMLPYQAEAGIHPSFDEMQLVVVRNKIRPKFPEVWKDTNQAIQALKETIEDCWDQDAEARLTAFCVEERVVEMLSLWSQDSKHKGVTPILMPSNVFMPEEHTDRHIYFDNIGTQSHRQNRISTTDNSSSPSVTVEGSIMAPIINDAHGGMTAQDISRNRPSWRNDCSVSESTTETIIPMSPSDSDLPPKSDNINNARNNTVLHPHQGRNPTVERNTHKCSDEELAISGNNLIINNKLLENGDGNQSLARDSIPSENLFETVTENLETSLVQNDVLNRQHRNPPIPYVQNQVRSESPLMRPKMANVPGNGPLIPYNKLTVNQAKCQKSRFSKFRPKDLGMKLFQLGIFSRSSSSKHSTNSGLPSVQKYGKEKKQNVPNQFSCNSMNLNGSAVSRNTINGNRAVRAQNPGQREPHPIQTEVRLQNGGPIVRPADLNVISSTQSIDINSSVGLSGLRYPENRLGIAEVGIAKLEMTRNGYPSVCRIHGAGYSKSTSDLSPEHSSRSSKWKETDLMEVLTSHLCKRPTTLSLRGHNYNRDNKPALSSLTVLSNAAISDVKLLSYSCRPGEKIKLRVKTPLTVKRGRFSLSDDRLMSQSCDNFASKSDTIVTKSSINLNKQY